MSNSSDFSDTSAATINGVIVDLDKSGASTSDNNIVGIDINTTYNPFEVNESKKKYVKIDSFSEKMDA